jgi:serine phosphatase RsbU (regulator of sigma subunit)
VPLKRLIRQAFSVQRTLPGRLFLLTASLLVVLWAIQLASGLPPILDIFRKVTKAAFLASLAWLVGRAILQGRRQWLWAVRRKLILSYVFFGVFPVVLLGVFVVVLGEMAYLNIAGYLFHTGYESVLTDVSRIAETTVVEVGQDPAATASVLNRRATNLRSVYPTVSLAAYSGSQHRLVASAGEWRHMAPPAALPQWVVDRARGFQGTLALVSAIGSTEQDLGADERLVMRAVMPSADGREFVLADLPVDPDVASRLFDLTGAHLEGVTFRSEAGNAAPIVAPVTFTPSRDSVERSIGTYLFRRTVFASDFTDWTTGNIGRMLVTLDAPAMELSRRMDSAQNLLGVVTVGGLLLVLAGLFLVIQLTALIGGVALARRITSAVHELFDGTARIGQGDFAHRIPIGSNDQLGDLAGSFNNMSASIEHLRHVEREKLRLDEELQIARRIQRSLLPTAAPAVDGLCISDLCEPALEVGGDYYDFFPLGPRRLGLMIADVSGKGTSAALYMAELKGLVLALSRTHASPRALLVELNDLLGNSLDNRSFITMTYAVIDLAAGTLTCARAGHTPMLVCRRGESRMITPGGMVLGLRLPGAAARFGELLEEHTQSIAPGDVIVLYTDGITEAMNVDGDLFGEQALTAVVAAHCALDSAGIRERILRDVRAFVGEAEPHDDMTMVVVKVQGAA